LSSEMILTMGYAEEKYDNLIGAVRNTVFTVGIWKNQSRNLVKHLENAIILEDKNFKTFQNYK
jgi:hypothetical protein